jgi:drug/metabolite transporter (DMT)-like permease
VAALRGKALAAYLVVCLLWGSTYLAMRVGVAALPPFLFAGTRFLVAGSLLLGGALAFGARLPRRPRDWAVLAAVGLFMLAGGNAFVVWAEQFTPSGVASLFVVTVALWMAVFDALLPGGSGRLTWRVMAGLMVGLAGTAMLVEADPRRLLHADLRGPVALTWASASWAFGSVFYGRHHADASPYVGAAIEMLAGGVVVTAAGLLLGEAHGVHFSVRGVGALGYLIVFGSLVGYSSYNYALHHASATAVGTYAYVNPVIAVLLGWLILGEQVGPRTFLAMGLILGAVLWIHAAHRAAAPEEAEPPPGD